MNFSDLVDYFEALCETHKQVQHSEDDKHFFKNQDDIENNLRAATKLPAVVMGPPEFSFAQTSHDGNYENNFISLLVLKFVKPGDKDDEFTAYDYCKQIAIDFVSKIRKDALDCNTIMNGIAINQVRIEPVGPVMDNFYGVVCDITFDTDIDLDYDESKWL